MHTPVLAFLMDRTIALMISNVWIAVSSTNGKWDVFSHNGHEAIMMLSPL